LLIDLTVESHIFWIVKPCCDVVGYQHFGRQYRNTLKPHMETRRGKTKNKILFPAHWDCNMITI